MKNNTTSLARSKSIKAISFLLSFIACLLIFASLTGAFCSFVLLDADFIGERAAKSNYVANRHDEMKEEFASFSEGYGIPEDIFIDVLESQNISEKIEANFMRMVSGSALDVDSKAFSNELKDRLDQYVQSQGYENTSQLQQDINLLVTQATTYYKQALNNDVVASVFSAFNKYKNPIKIASILSFFAAFVLYTLTFLMNRRHRAYQAVRYTMLSLIGAGLMFSVAPAAIMLDGLYKRIGLFANASMYNLYLSFAQFILLAFLALGLVLIAIAFGGGLPLYHKLKRKAVSIEM